MRVWGMGGYQYQNKARPTLFEVAEQVADSLSLVLSEQGLGGGRVDHASAVPASPPVARTCATHLLLRNVYMDGS